MNDLKPWRVWVKDCAINPHSKRPRQVEEVVSINWEYRQVRIKHMGCLFSFDEVVFLKPTGLRDKNGKEIYEGDILEWAQFKLLITIDNYHGYRFMAGKDQMCKEYAMSGKIIGNIYENPDLLEETK